MIKTIQKKKIQFFFYKTLFFPAELHYSVTASYTLPNTFLRISLAHWNGFLRIAFSWSPTFRNKPSRAFCVVYSPKSVFTS